MLREEAFDGRVVLLGAEAERPTSARRCRRTICAATRRTRRPTFTRSVPRRAVDRAPDVDGGEQARRGVTMLARDAPTRPYPRARCRRRLPRHPPRPRRRVPSAVPRASPSPSGSWLTDWRRPTRARSPRLPAERPRSRWTAISVPSIRARRGPSTRSRRYARTSVAGWTGTTPIGRGTDPATALASTTGRLLQGLAKRALKPKPIPAAACGPAPRRGGRALDSLERLQERASRSDSTPYRGTCSREAPSESAYVTTRSPGRRPTRRSLAQAIAEFDRYLPFGPRNDCNPHSYAVPWIPPRGFEAPPPSLARAVLAC